MGGCEGNSTPGMWVKTPGVSDILGGKSTGKAARCESLSADGRSMCTSSLPRHETGIQATSPPALTADSQRSLAVTGQAAVHVERLGDDDMRAFSALLADLSATFVKLPTGEIDAHIDQALQRLGEFLQVDRLSFAEFSDNARDMVVTHSYVAPGVQPYPRSVVDDALPWYAEQIRRGAVLRFSRLPDDLPIEAIIERQYCLREGLKSNLTVPLRASGAVRCVITLASFRDYREWPAELVQWLRLIGEIFAGSLARKRSELQLQSAREQLTRLGRAMLLGELAAAIAHEINQPLCAIVSNAQAGQRMLAAPQPDLMELGETLRDIAADSDRATEVVKRVRGMLQKQVTRFTPLQLNDAITEVVALMRGQLLHKQVSVTLDLQPDLPLVAGDRIQLQQVILNLALNSIEAMSHDSIECRQLHIATRLSADEQVVITVRDTGPGIGAAEANEIFNPFFTTKPTGMGIGLAICQSITESHAGNIWYDAAATSGAVFHVSLPLTREILP